MAKSLIRKAYEKFTPEGKAEVAERKQSSRRQKNIRKEAAKQGLYDDWIPTHLTDEHMREALKGKGFKEGGKAGKTLVKKALGGKINPGTDMQGRQDPQWGQPWHDAGDVLEKGGKVQKEYAHSAIDGLIKKNGK